MPHAGDQSELNPYEPPHAQRMQAERPPEQGKCPTCGNPNYRKVSFTWWGGVIGPRLLKHVKCTQCGTGYNSATGRNNMTSIVAYQLVGLLLLIVMIATFVFTRR